MSWYSFHLDMLMLVLLIYPTYWIRLEVGNEIYVRHLWLVMRSMDVISAKNLPHCFELMWSEEKHPTPLIKGRWKEMKVEGWAGFRLAVKLKTLKLKEWAKTNFGDFELQKDAILEEIQILDNKEKLGQLSSEDCNRKLSLKDNFHRKLR